jgi:hypothetical protein
VYSCLLCSGTSIFCGDHIVQKSFFILLLFFFFKKKNPHKSLEATHLARLCTEELILRWIQDSPR